MYKKFKISKTNNEIKVEVIREKVFDIYMLCIMFLHNTYQ